MSRISWTYRRPKMLTYFLQCISVLLTISVAVLGDMYLNEWAVEIEGGSEYASQIARSLGFVSRGQIGALRDHYLFIHHGVEKRSVYYHQQHHKVLSEHPEVQWVAQQVSKKRVKRDFIFSKKGGEEQYPGHSPYNPHLNDVLYPEQWYLHHGAKDHNDMNVLAAWQQGYTGRGVVVTILDDGLERSHHDLIDNYDSRASYDINADDDDPMPRYDPTDENRHGTRCAGEVAAMANNTMCGVGIAYNAKIGGVRMLDGDVSDAVEARSLSLSRDHIDIYSASWGPDDNGRVVDGPARMAMKAFVDGVTLGRRGKGSIFVWASGNGGSDDDSCNCDGYTNSIYTLSISSVSEKNLKPWYLEECSSTLASTYSSGASFTEKQIVTTDLHNKCTARHTGTSASAPLAAAIAALTLEANPRLTWRDMQHIVVMTSRAHAIRNDGSWVVNGAGRAVSLRYGYGLMDAGAMVSLAERWNQVPKQHICTTAIMDTNTPINGRSTIVFNVSDGCARNPGQRIGFLEHVQARISLRYTRRGNLQIHLVSPNGTRSTLLPKRKKDVREGSFDRWPFMSVHFWGESPVGRWQLELSNPDSPGDYGHLGSWQLVFYGTSTSPINLREPVRKSADSGKDYVYQPVVCHPECQGGCHGPQAVDCIKCKHFRNGADGPCVSECEQAEFADPVTGLCVSCHGSCYSCQGPELTDCTDCADGIYLVEEAGRCTAQCADGYYADDAHGVCRQCHYPCMTCTHGPDQCSGCSEDMQLEEGTCNSHCHPNQYRDVNGRCLMCHIACARCTGPGLHQCTRCPGGAYYVNGSCVHECGQGYYEDTRLGECQSCHPVCLKCTGAQSRDCISCDPDEILQQGTCYPKEACADGQYADQMSGGRCQPCHVTCPRCRSASRHDCVSCAQDRVYDAGQCVQSCGSGSYELVSPDSDGSVLRRCQPCHRSCHQCTGGTGDHCATCRPGLKLVDGRCENDCNTGYYTFNNVDCRPCHAVCRACNGPSIDHCTACPDGQLLHSGQCLHACPYGYFASLADKCTRCYHTCSTCSAENPSSCLSCDEGYLLRHGHCIGLWPCSPGMYYDLNTQSCLFCHETCQSCRGAGSYNCTTCSAPSTYSRHEGRCVVCCSSKHYDAVCCICDPATGSCDDSYLSSARSSFVKSTSVKQQQQQAWSSAGLVMLAIAGCTVILLLFFLIFGLLQASTNGYYCFRPKISYHAVDALYNDQIMLTKEDFSDEDEIYTTNGTNSCIKILPGKDEDIS